MQIYYYTETPEDQRAPHRGEDLTAEDLEKLGVLSAYMADGVAGVNALAAARGYKNRDEIVVSPAAMDAYEAKVRMFFDEHLHEDEEIRYILEGRGYFDVRGLGDRWVRCALDPGDLIVLPAGIWHRFTTDENNYVKAMRLFKDEPKWTPLNRAPELEENAFRKQYVEQFLAA